MQFLDLDPHGNAQLGVEVRQRLVEEEDLQIADNCPSHRDALPLAARQLLRKAVEKVRDVQDFGRLAHPLRDVAILGQDAVDDPPADADLARSDRLEPRDHPGQGGLPQPDGSTRTTNSPSPMSALTPCITSRLPTFLTILSILTSAPPALHPMAATTYCGIAICIFTSLGGADAATSKACTLSSNSNLRVISGFTSIAPDDSILTQRGKTWA